MGPYINIISGRRAGKTETLLNLLVAELRQNPGGYYLIHVPFAAQRRTHEERLLDKLGDDKDLARHVRIISKHTMISTRGGFYEAIFVDDADYLDSNDLHQLNLIPRKRSYFVYDDGSEPVNNYSHVLAQIFANED